MNKSKIPCSRCHGTGYMIEERLEKRDKMVKVDGKFFRCDCGCNIFRNPIGKPNVYICNSCETRYEGE